MKANQIPYLVIAILALFIAFDQCTRKPCPEPQLSSTTTEIIPGDSIPKPALTVKPVKPQIIHNTVTREVDTGAIIRDYLAQVVYKDIVLKDDSLLFASVDAYLSKNRIDSLKPYFAIRKPTAIINKTVYVYPEAEKPGKVRQFGLEAGVFGYAAPFGNDAGPFAEVKLKRWQIGYGYGLHKTHLFKTTYTIW